MQEQITTQANAGREQQTLLRTIPDDQRKLATILFADVSGFAELSETLDAEDVASLINAFWQLLDPLVLGFGGLVNKHMGDEVVAIWGAEQAREADPEQAVRAALAIQAVLAAFGQERGLVLGMCIGISSGPVLLGNVGITHEFTTIGDRSTSPHVWSRLHRLGKYGFPMTPSATSAVCSSFVPRNYLVSKASMSRCKHTSLSMPKRACLPAQLAGLMGLRLVLSGVLENCSSSRTPIVT